MMLTLVKTFRPGTLAESMERHIRKAFRDFPMFDALEVRSGDLSCVVTRDLLDMPAFFLHHELTDHAGFPCKPHPALLLTERPASDV
jgi:hypothetical protein